MGSPDVRVRASFFEGMPLRISVCPYRLLFKHPFGTAHGLRDGTDALFVRVEEDGLVGHGEITLPPYLRESVPEARRRLREIGAMHVWDMESLLSELDAIRALRGSPATRAGLHTALCDAMARRHGRSIAEELGIAGLESPATVLTIGFCKPAEAIARLREMPDKVALKLKVGDPLAISRIKDLLECSSARILLDGNQGFGSVADAVQIIDAVPPERLIGIEQPFGTEHDDWNEQLSRETGAVVIADESMQGIEDLERVFGMFGGVNIKLMKCGGLDRARDIAKRADQYNLRVMLGCMSESSLGCGAMAQLASEASILDLDGPWLLANDPWQGLSIEAGRLHLPNGPGVGVHERFPLDYIDP